MLKIGYAIQRDILPQQTPSDRAGLAMVQRIKLTGAASAVPKTFIYCRSPATGSFDQFAAKYRSAPGWRFHELATGHDAMILMPERVAELLRK